MIHLIVKICGFYSYEYIIKLMSMIEIFFCIIFYTFPFKKRKWFYTKLFGSLIFGLLYLYPLAVFRTHNMTTISNILVTYFIYLFVFGILVLLYQEKLPELLLCLCAGVATQIIVGRLYEILLILFGKNAYTNFSLFRHFFAVEWYDWISFYLIHIALIFLVALLFRKKEVYKHDRTSTLIIVIFSLIFTLITIPLNAISRPLEASNFSLALIIRIFSILYALLVLSLRTGILEQSRMKQELQILNELLYLENKQFDSLRNDIEIINIKCHDIRNQFVQFEDKLTKHEIDTMKSAIQIYDSNIKTGSEILDVILYKKQLICEKFHIQMSCIADGSSLSFISTSHLYSLFSNAIENAIEAVQQIEDIEKRIISITVGKENGLIAIHITNYFDGICDIKNGIPQTNKKDKSHHGYGAKSIRYIVDLYHGRVSFQTDEDIFYLHIYLPCMD